MRSSDSERARRVNAAIALLKKPTRKAEVVSAIMRRFGISRRQAYRYIHSAEMAGKPMEMPEQKVVFTVKLPQGLAARIRRLADSSERTLSAVVAQALETFLRSGRRHGQREPSETG